MPEQLEKKHLTNLALMSFGMWIFQFVREVYLTQRVSGVSEYFASYNSVWLIGGIICLLVSILLFKNSKKNQ